MPRLSASPGWPFPWPSQGLFRSRLYPSSKANLISATLWTSPVLWSVTWQPRVDVTVLASQRVCTGQCVHTRLTPFDGPSVVKLGLFIFSQQESIVAQLPVVGTCCPHFQFCWKELLNPRVSMTCYLLTISSHAVANTKVVILVENKHQSGSTGFSKQQWRRLRATWKLPDTLALGVLLCRGGTGSFILCVFSPEAPPVVQVLL